MDSPAAGQIRATEPLWMDVAGISGYPVFDVKRGWGGDDGQYTFPDEAVIASERRKIGQAQRFTAPQRHDARLDRRAPAPRRHLDRPRAAARRRVRATIFRSQAKYWEPAGAVSWDVAMTVSDPWWRVKVSAGDELRLSATYDSERAAWYESMGINFLWYVPGDVEGAKDPFTDRSTPSARSPTATCRRTTTTAGRASPACPTRAGCSPGRRATP